MWSGCPTPSPAVSAGAPPMSFKLHARIARADNMTQRHTDTHDMTDTPCRGFAITAIRKITSCCSGFAIMAVRKITKGLVETSHRGVSHAKMLTGRVYQRYKVVVCNHFVTTDATPWIGRHHGVTSLQVPSLSSEQP